MNKYKMREKSLERTSESCYRSKPQERSKRKLYSVTQWTWIHTNLDFDSKYNWRRDI